MKEMPTYEELLAMQETWAREKKCMLGVINDMSEKINDMSEKMNELLELLKRKDERIAQLEQMHFGSKSDKKKGGTLPPGPGLFDDQFNEASEAEAEAVKKTVKEIDETAQKRRQKAKREPKRPGKYRYCGLEERITTLYPEGINMDDYDIIGNDVTRILHSQEAKLWVEVIERPILRRKADKYNPNPCILQAEVPRAIIGGNHVAADVLSQLIIDKFVYHIPEYRQVKRYADMGVTLPASTINDWIHAVANKLYPLYEALAEDLRSRCYLQVDEVPWNIADGKGKTRKGYAWQFFDATPDSHGLYFYYYKGSRAVTIPQAQLHGYRGAIQADGYAAYEYLEKQDGVTLLGCMAHVRRKFIEAQNSHPRLAAEALRYIEILYELEANLRDANATPEETAAQRQAKALPIMDAMEAWMKAASTQCTPGDLMGKALSYAYQQWPRLKRYALNGIYQIDNNPVERHQRPTVMGRKNYLFCKNDRGAEDNAVFYSLLESCDAVGLNPLAWLTDILGKLHDDMDDDALRQLLPYYYKKSRE